MTSPALQAAKEALRPFADAMKLQDDYCREVGTNPFNDKAIGPGVTMGALRRAAEALALIDAEQSRDACPEVAHTPEPEEKQSRVPEDRERLAELLTELEGTVPPTLRGLLKQAAAIIRQPTAMEVKELAKRLDMLRWGAQPMNIIGGQPVDKLVDDVLALIRLPASAEVEEMARRLDEAQTRFRFEIGTFDDLNIIRDAIALLRRLSPATGSPSGAEEMGERAAKAATPEIERDAAIASSTADREALSRALDRERALEAENKTAHQLIERCCSNLWNVRLKRDALRARVGVLSAALAEWAGARTAVNNFDGVPDIRVDGDFKPLLARLAAAESVLAHSALSAKSEPRPETDWDDPGVEHGYVPISAKSESAPTKEETP